MGSGHETTNRSVGRAHGCMTYAISLGCSVSRLLTRHNQGIAQWSPDPFPRERVGSGHETSSAWLGSYQNFTRLWDSALFDKGFLKKP